MKKKFSFSKTSGNLNNTLKNGYLIKCIPHLGSLGGFGGLNIVKSVLGGL